MGDTSSLIMMLDLYLVPLLCNGVSHWCLDVASETLLVVFMVCGIILIWRVIGLLMYCQSGSSWTSKPWPWGLIWALLFFHITFSHYYIKQILSEVAAVSRAFNFAFQSLLLNSVYLYIYASFVVITLPVCCGVPQTQKLKSPLLGIKSNTPVLKHGIDQNTALHALPAAMQIMLSQFIELSDFYLHFTMTFMVNCIQ